MISKVFTYYNPFQKPKSYPETSEEPELKPLGFPFLYKRGVDRF